MRFSYCPVCGSKLGLKNIGDEGLIPFCNICKKPWFPQSEIAVIVLVVNEFDEVLLISENRPNDTHPVLIAGYVKEFESFDQSAIREVYEETGQTIEKLEYLASHPYQEKDLVMIAYIGYVKKRALKLSGELENAVWVSYQKASSLLKPGSIALKVFLAYEEKYHGKSIDNSL